jgi:hypothetical protein
MRKVAAAIALALFTLSILLACLCGFSHAAVSKKHDNSLGVVQYQTNPYTYFEGALISGAIIEPGVNLRFQPRGTYGLFSQEILFCNYDSVAEKFSGKSGLLVLTYETVAHRTIQGIGCHDLRTVDVVKEERLK